MVIGDDHRANDKAGKAIQEALRCRVVKRKKFYREAGYDQVSALALPGSVGECSNSSTILTVLGQQALSAWRQTGVARVLKEVEGNACAG